MRRSPRLVVLLVALALMLSACGFRLEHLVEVNEDGSGTIDCLALIDEGDADFDAGRFGLLDQPPEGWTLEPVDDGAYEGTRSTAAFDDPDELVALLGALAEAGEETGAGDGCAGLSTEGPEALLDVDLAGATWTQRFEDEPVNEDELGLDEALDEITEASITVRLPGTLDEHDGDAVADDGTVTWELSITDPDDLSARSIIREADNRLDGANRHETAAAISERFFDAGVDVAFVADGFGFADALSASGAAGAADAPVLLTDHDALPDATRTELERLAPERIVVLGGEAAVADGVKDELGDLAAEVDRIAGGNRYETATEVTAEFFEAGVETAYLATGEDFPDALGGGAAAAVQGQPLLLTTAETLPAATRGELERLAPERIVVLGGEAAVADGVKNELGDLAAEVDRIAGDNRYDTARLVAEDAFEAADNVLVATGVSAPDALAGAAAAAQANGPVLLTMPDALPSGLASTIEGLRPSEVLVLGGPAAVADAVAIELGDLAP